jgi:hypothetical protein
MSKTKSIIKVLFFVICAAALSCSNGEGNAIVTIDIGQSKKIIESKGPAPLDIYSIALTVDGAGMARIEKTIDIATGTITLEVPAGRNRTFTLFVGCDDLSFYNGAKSVDLQPGENATIIINMLEQTPVALNLPNLAGAGSYTQGTYLIGFEFKANIAISITQLGYYDSNLASPAETFAPTVVGVYNMSTHTLLGSDTVIAADPAITIFRYHTLASPITLNTTDTYAVVAVTGSNYYAAWYNYNAQANAALTWIGFAGHGENGLTTTSVLVEPDWFWTSTAGDIGPNFVFEMN